jgi:small multidrug resistance pump
MSLPLSYLYLGIAVVLEVLATSALKSSDGFSRLGPSLVSLIGYSISAWLGSLVVRRIPLGIAYGISSGVGMILVTFVGWVWFKQMLDAPAVIGLCLILTGVVVSNGWSKSVRR